MELIHVLNLCNALQEPASQEASVGEQREKSSRTKQQTRVLLVVTSFCLVWKEFGGSKTRWETDTFVGVNTLSFRLNASLFFCSETFPY